MKDKHDNYKRVFIRTIYIVAEHSIYYWAKAFYHSGEQYANIVASTCHNSPFEPCFILRKLFLY
jgi:hypothetical protein